MISLPGVCLSLLVVTSTPPPPGAGVEGALETRLEFLQDTFDQQQTFSRVWWWGWFTGYSASALGSLAVAYEDLYPERTTSLWTNGIKSSLAALNMIFFRPCVQCDGGTRFAALPEESLVQRRDKVLRGEQLLGQMAEEGSAHFKWVRHVLGFGVNATASVLQWQALQRDGDVPSEEISRQVLTSLVTGLVVTELNIFSEPWGAPRRLVEYSALSDDPEASLQWWFTPTPGGVSVVGRF